MEEKLAALELREFQIAARIERAKMEKCRLEEASSEDEAHEEEELMERRVDQWFEQQPTPAEAERPPSPPRPPARAITAPASVAEPPPRPRENHEYQSTRYVTMPILSDNQPRPAAPAHAQIDALAAQVASQVNARRAPHYITELPSYGGRAEEWLLFKATFEQTCDRFAPGENVARLRHSLRGPALEAITSLLITQSAPEEIMRALERRFGRPDALVMAEMEKLRTLPRVSDTPREVCVFANKLNNIVRTIEVLHKPHYLHSPEMLRAAVEKLPPLLRDKWYECAASDRSGRPELITLTEFLNHQADMRAPYAPPELETKPEAPRNPARQKKMERTFVTEDTKDECPMCARPHALPDCKRFIEADVEKRWEVTKKNKVCFRCLRSTHRRDSCRARVCGEAGCTLRHHRLLHYKRRELPIAPPPPQTEEIHASAIGTEIANAAQTRRRAYLKVAQVTLIGPKGSRDTYALLDEGSTVTIIDQQLADAVGLEGPTEVMKVQGVSGKVTTHADSKRVTAHIKGRYETETHEMNDARTFGDMNSFTQSVRPCDIENCTHLDDVKTQLLYDSATPTILVGQDNWELIVSREVRSGPRHQPVASRTHLGWVLHGCRTTTTYPMVFCGRLDAAPEEDKLEGLMRRHFELESLGVAPRRQASDPEERALSILKEKSRRLPDGHFETGMLWRDPSAPIRHTGYEDAKKRLVSLERKLDKNEDLKLQYSERIENLLTSGYAERAPAPPIGGRVWYLPHFAVVNPDKKKIRVVHDAAAKARGVSLNDMLLPGPDLLQSLPAVIMKFRQHRVAVTSDIKEMFMQVKVREEDRDALRFLWRGTRRDAAAPPEEYRMTSIIFGASSSPCSALYIKNRNAEENAHECPAAADAIVNNHYMDDYLHSFDTTEEAAHITTAVDRIHRRAGFELRGWTSNDEAAIRHFAPRLDSAHSDTVEIGGNDYEKTLGLLWYVKEDLLGFRVNQRRVHPDVLSGLREPTKREALSLIMSIFDPLGLISPITTPAKRIMQDTWKYKTGWDDPIPQALHDRWQSWLMGLRELHTLQIPRCYDKEPAAEYELHTFVDASEEAYAAVVYIRIQRADGSIQVSIAAAKSRVTPTKPISVPRLELQAALLGARLARSVQEGHNFDFARRTYWSDSRTALHWIRDEPRTYKTFVAHRLAEIEDLTKKDEWRWVPTAVNVADDSTRATPADMSPQHRWFTGPEFLRSDPEEWPREDKKEVPTTGEERAAVIALPVAANVAPLIDVDRFSKWNRLLRATARALQFIELCRQRHLSNAARRKRTKKIEGDDDWRKRPANNKAAKRPPPIVAAPREYIPLPARHLYAAEMLLVRTSQRDMSRATNKDSPLADLSVFTDPDGVLRLRGRIREANDVSFEAANPIILDGKHRYTRLYVQHTHERLHHGGVEIVVNELRQRVWMARIRPTVKEVLKSCPPCRLKRAKPAQPSTGDLPSARLAHHNRPFTFSGLDYFGPLEVTVGRRREKRYVALFTCMTSRAVHLEVVASLSADSAIHALRRMIARRGCPTELWSDNATCFRAADRELAEAWRALEDEASRRRINWRFLPPSAPFMAGVWERMVRTVKEALRVTLHEQRPSDETLATLLAEVEATVNSRPLTHVPVTPEDPPALTPNSILLGPDCHIPAPCAYEEDETAARTHWRRAQRLADIFWRRWVKEYMPLLQHRREPHATGAPPKIGDVVVICDSNLPRNTWPRGRVTRVYPGKDGEVRVVDVTTSSGRVLRRPTKKVIVLPTGSPAATAGECSR